MRYTRLIINPLEVITKGLRKKPCPYKFKLGLTSKK
jgi:hypothetical protein